MLLVDPPHLAEQRHDHVVLGALLFCRNIQSEAVAHPPGMRAHLRLEIQHLPRQPLQRHRLRQLLVGHDPAPPWM